MKVTPWYPKEITPLPDRPGWYESKSLHGQIQPIYWDGQQFSHEYCSLIYPPYWRGEVR